MNAIDCILALIASIIVIIIYIAVSIAEIICFVPYSAFHFIAKNLSILNAKLTSYVKSRCAKQ